MVGKVVVVGGGILGTMHALAARQRGFEVTHLEREPEARGASVRNFGLIWVSGRRPGDELALALRARQLWEQVPGIAFRPAGSVTVAASEAELGLMKEASALPDAAQRGFKLLDAAGVRSVNPAVRGDILGGLYCPADAIVEPRLVLPSLRAALAGPGYEWLPGREITDVRAGAVLDHTGTWHRGDLVALCTGAAARFIDGLPARRVRLQMMQTAPLAAKLTTALADGDSLRYYPAYELPGRAQLAPQDPVAALARAQLLLVQRADGSLTIGDTHEYDQPFAFDVDSDAYDHLLARAQAVLGVPLPPVQRRWAGVYSETTDGALYLRREVADGVVLVTAPGGRGMTCAPAIAEETFI
ncbi:MAG: TIGR03364 family FAD-dependent oxidoreductase [Streptosporangiaceae bacterium]